MGFYACLGFFVGDVTTVLHAKQEKLISGEYLWLARVIGGVVVSIYTRFLCLVDL